MKTMVHGQQKAGHPCHLLHVSSLETGSYSFLWIRFSNSYSGPAGNKLLAPIQVVNICKINVIHRKQLGLDIIYSLRFQITVSL